MKIGEYEKNAPVVETQERENLKELLEYLKKQAGKLVRENADTVQGINESVRMLNGVLATEERMIRIAKGDVYPYVSE